MKNHIPRRSGVGARQVLIPGKRKAVPHALSMVAFAARREAERKASEVTA